MTDHHERRPAVRACADLVVAVGEVIEGERSVTRRGDEHVERRQRRASGQPDRSACQRRPLVAQRARHTAGREVDVEVGERRVTVDDGHRDVVLQATDRGWIGRATRPVGTTRGTFPAGARERRCRRRVSKSRWRVHGSSTRR